MAAKEYNRKDHFYQKAKKEGYRSRAAYKLLEMDKKHSLFAKGYKVADLGCYPGSWLQVALEKVGESGLVVGIDLQDIEPLEFDNLRVLKGDFTDPDVQQSLRDLVGGPLNLVMSDLSPSLTGIRMRDALYSADLVERAFYFATQTLVAGGAFVAKIFPGNECEEVAKQIKPCFRKFSRMHLASTRGSSKELYFVALGFSPENAPQW